MNHASPPSGRNRRFLFLQGPHGPFFAQLGAALRRTGAVCHRVGFNGGDRLFWWPGQSYLPFDGTLDAWPDALEAILERHAITDVVLYGDTRPVHAAAVRVCRARGTTVHVFEEGYLRPYWVTYERDGANGNSPLMSLGIDAIRTRLSEGQPETGEVPSHWGNMREHMFYGAIYHAAVMARPGRRLPPHRGTSVAREFRLHLARLLLLPVHVAGRLVATSRILRGGFPYHLVLLQLEHDASFRAWSDFGSMTEFVDLVTEGFARGAPAHHHLVFKAHPLEDGRAPIAAAIRDSARRRGLDGRVHFVRGGKLARLLDHARSAVTVNSTSAQQALWRGLPVRCFGTAVYAKPGLVSSQSLTEFFSGPVRPDVAAYQDFRRFLLETSQVSGGFYSEGSRRQLLRQIVDLMLDPASPYDRQSNAGAAVPQQLRLVR